MRVQFVSVCLALCSVLTMEGSAFAQGPGTKGIAFSLAGVPYFYRFSNGNMHEYTPAGQLDLNAWRDMVTINRYPIVKNEVALAAAANTVLKKYKEAKGVVVRTASVPKTKDRPAEHLIVVAFAQRGATEAAFARFRMHGGIGTSVVYSHRIYGKNSGNAMSAWLKKNGAMTEKSLMQWNAMPAAPAPK